MHHAVKVILILQMGFVESDEQKIVKVTRFFLKLWNYGNLQFSFAGKLVVEQGLAGTVIVMFFGHMEPHVHSKEQILLYAGSKSQKVAHFHATIIMTIRK